MNTWKSLPPLAAFWILAPVIALAGCRQGEPGAEQPAPTATVTVTENVVVTESVSPPPTSEPVEQVEPTPTKPSVPTSPLLGTWAGGVDQDGSLSYSVRVTITASGDRLVGKFDYPELGCLGDWVPHSTTGDAYVFIERLTIEGSCIDGVKIMIQPQADGTLAYGFDHEGYVGSATLTQDDGPPVTGKPLRASSGWPTGDSEASSAMMIWFGAAWRAGESSVGFPEWVSCASPDLCIAGAEDVVGVIESQQYGLAEVATIPISAAPRESLLRLGYDSQTVDTLLRSG